MVKVKVGETNAARRRMRFDVRSSTDGITPVTNAAGGQPQISVNDAAFTATGIGTLVQVGQCRYYAEVDTSVLTTIGDLIEGRFQAAGTAETPADQEFFVVAYDDANLVADVDTRLTAQHGTGSWKQAIVVAGTVTGAGQSVTADLVGRSGTHFTHVFTLEGWDGSAATKFAFTLKASAAADADEHALIVVRKTVAGAGDDGLKVWNRRAAAAADAGLASITVDTTVPNTLVLTLTVTAQAMDVPASGSGDYAYEFNEFTGTVKRTPWKGKFKVEQAVRRGPAAP